jgi:hypothetical protein
MNKKGARRTVYVCSAISQNNDLVNRIVEADSQDDASKLFFDQTSVKAQEIFGPFFKKRTRVLESTRSLKFSGETKKAVYNDWIVNAFMLKEPDGHAYLIFVKRVDNKKASTPVGTIVVPVSDLRFM